ncbi:Adenosylcobinamide-GDP ribazoletransferase [Fundidesulfovibrio magnetotacticus]|uniref:Adenosylcobinamide-GDP ribazoletransferase n=1 Tax=Fundidesulfovibrio magnetotacticus TaxID=2730080 RepID=A0A6V8LJH0_9BACT|nr:adenosylcobinamide-GDP ribazoletransferase [Fundidesulfovibrio magnetotacticus]GFK92873.1 Adenosylcobinamide-GDP ribazoletransferase [Fundidesulfovibrio magnetotacticus]
MPRCLEGLRLALSFLTVLAPARAEPDDAFPRALPWFPVAGLVVGLLATLPAWLGLFAHTPFLAGWTVALLGLLLTRGLHADGLADIADAVGSAATGDRFWAILKDSRAGPFAVMALALALTAQASACGELASQGRLGVVVWSFVAGRTAGLAVLHVCRSRARPGLGALFARGATPRLIALGVALCAILGFALAGLRDTALGLAACAAVTWALARISRRQGGFNGDFVGAAIVLGEVTVVLAAVAA